MLLGAELLTETGGSEWPRMKQENPREPGHPAIRAHQEFAKTKTNTTCLKYQSPLEKLVVQNML